MKKKIKVAISYLIYPCSMAEYFVRAFRRRSDVELWTVGPYTGDWIPWNGGMNVHTNEVRPPDLPLSVNLSGYPFGMVAPYLPWHPDLFIQVDAGFHFQGRPVGEKVALVQTDPHCLDYSLPKSYSDYSFCMQTPYMKPGDVFLPYAYDPTVHYPMELEKEYDACLIGLHYQQRDLLVKAIQEKGYKVYYDLGKVFDENRILYNKSKVALSWSSLQDTPARVFEAMGMGIPLLCNRTPDLMDLFQDGTHFMGFDTMGEAVGKFEILMHDDVLYTRLKACSRAEVNLKHTWDHRVTKILEVCGLV